MQNVLRSRQNMSKLKNFFQNKRATLNANSQESSKNHLERDYKKYSRNLLANWVGYGAGLIAMFFLSPFVVHRLGDTQYGLWSLLISLTGYMGLIELGTRGGLDRFINYHLGRDDTLSVNKIINTGLTFFTLSGLGLLIVAAAIAAAFHLLFQKIPHELLNVARLTVLLVALNLWLSFLGTPFFQILTAFERFDLVNAVNLVVLAVRTTLIVLVLLAGHGIVALALVQAIATLLGNIAALLIAKKIFPDLRLSFALANRQQFRQLFTFSLWTFIGNIAMQLLYWTDNIIIATFLGPEMVTYFSIGSMLLIHARNFTNQCSSIFNPQIIKTIARKDWPNLHTLFLQASNLIMAVAILLLVGISVFGHDFITLWMGPLYAQKSYNVLLILTISQFPALAILLGSSVIMGLNKVRFSAMISFSQALVNLGLSILFVKYFAMGIDGVAWGTFYPRILFTLFIHYAILRWIGLPVWQFLKNEGFKWLASILAFTAISILVNKYNCELSWISLTAKIGLTGLLYIPLAWFGLFSKSERNIILNFLEKKSVPINTNLKIADSFSQTID